MKPPTISCRHPWEKPKCFMVKSLGFVLAETETKKKQSSQPIFDCRNYQKLINHISLRATLIVNSLLLLVLLLLLLLPLAESHGNSGEAAVNRSPKSCFPQSSARPCWLAGRKTQASPWVTGPKCAGQWSRLAEGIFHMFMGKFTINGDFP